MKRFGLAVIVGLAIWLGLNAIGRDRVTSSLNGAADNLEAAAESIPRLAIEGDADKLPVVVRRERDHSAYCARRQNSNPAPTEPFAATEIRVHDADTLIIGEERVRVSNLDAPEIPPRSRCPEEERRGREATAEADRFLSTAQQVTITPDGTRDQFCRIRATISADGVDLARHIIERELGAPWAGRTRDWCASPT